MEVNALRFGIQQTMLFISIDQMCFLEMYIKYLYVLLPYITYVMESGRFSQYPAILSRTAKERDKKYSVKSPQRYKK